MPQFAETTLLVTVALVQAGLGLAMGVLLLSLHRFSRRRYLVYWAAAWLILAVRSLLAAASLSAGVESAAGGSLGRVNILLAYLQVPALGLAAASLRTGTPARLTHRLLIGGTLMLGALLVTAAGLMDAPFQARVMVTVLPPYLLIVSTNVWFALTFVRFSPRPAGLAATLVTAFGLLYAAHIFLVTLGWTGVSPYPNATVPAVLGLLLPMGITTGIVLSVFEDAHDTGQRLAESESTSSALVEAIPDTLFILDSEAVFRHYVPARDFAPLVPPEQFLGQRAREVLPPDLARLLEARVTEALETGETQAFEYSLGRADTAEHYEARLTRSGSDRVIGIVRDVTRRKGAEADRQALLAELGEKTVELETRNAEMERFTYTVSHDLRSPLMTILGFLGFAEQALARENSNQVREDFTRIRLAASRMELLLRDLLELSHLGRAASPAQEVRLGDVAREAVALLDGTLRAHGVLVQIDDDLPIVLGDPVRLREVFQNLLENAARFYAASPAPLVTIGARTGDDPLRPIVFVRDNGMGIDSADHERVFRLFEKLDAASEGTGVGLAIVKRIVEGHGGRIWVESAGAGQGSTFCFTLARAVGTPTS